MNRLRANLGELLLLMSASAAIFSLTFFARVSGTNSDTYYGLLVSLALLEEGTIRLDAYETRTEPPLPESDYRLLRRNGHIYYAFPLGTSIATVPVVAAARWLGRDMLVMNEQNRIENGLAALSCVLIFWLLHGLARLRLRFGPAFTLSLIFLLGTSLISSLGNALWSHHGAVVAALLVLILLSLADRDRWPRRAALPGGALLGALLFAGYLFRPAMAVFVALVFLYLGARAAKEGEWRAFTAAAVTGGALFALFLLLSQREFGTWFPPYYSPARVQDYAGRGTLGALYGLLLSPGRGLLVFSPFLLLLPLATARHWGAVRREPLLWLTLAWLPLQLWLLTRAVVWWGGWSYGPRLLSDVIPGLLLWAVLLWANGRPQVDRATARRWAALFIVLGVASVAIHGASGLFNTETPRWNGVVAPNIDDYPGYLLDWRYPQFLASRAQLCARNDDFFAERLAEAPPGEAAWNRPVPYDDPAIYFAGWSIPIASLQARWSECNPARILFVAPAQPPGALLTLHLEGISDELTQAAVAVNGTALGTWTVAPGPPARTALSLPADLLQPDGVNVLELTVPDAGASLRGGTARRGIGIRSWTLAPE